MSLWLWFSHWCLNVVFLFNLSFQLTVGQCFGTLGKVEGREPNSGWDLVSLLLRNSYTIACKMEKGIGVWAGGGGGGGKMLMTGQWHKRENKVSSKSLYDFSFNEFLEFTRLRVSVVVTEYASLNITTFRIIVVSLDVGIANVFDFNAAWVCLYPNFNTCAFGHCSNLWQTRMSTPPSLKVLARLWKRGRK